VLCLFTRYQISASVTDWLFLPLTRDIANFSRQGLKHISRGSRKLQPCRQISPLSLTIKVFFQENQLIVLRRDLLGFQILFRGVTTFEQPSSWHSRMLLLKGALEGATRPTVVCSSCGGEDTPPSTPRLRLRRVTMIIREPFTKARMYDQPKPRTAAEPPEPESAGSSILAAGKGKASDFSTVCEPPVIPASRFVSRTTR